MDLVWATRSPQVAMLRKQVRLVKDFSVHQFETGSTTVSERFFFHCHKTDSLSSAFEFSH